MSDGQHKAVRKLILSARAADLHRSTIAKLAPQAELVVLQPDGTTAGDPADAEVFYFSLDLAEERSTLTAAVGFLGIDTLQWVQSPGAGYDHQMWTDLLDRGVCFTNASGVHAEPIAQYIFTYVLHWHRRVAEHTQQQADREWNRIVSDDLTTKTLGIVGYGGIGQATARVAQSFGMQVLALRRSPIDDPNVDEAFLPADLHRLLAESDYVVLSLPLNEHTRHTIGPAELAAMRNDAVLINVARGDVVDQDALIEALQARSIRGATLDVVEPEPLEDDSPLWTLDNCIVTPHDAGYSPLGDTRLDALFLDNLERWVTGAELRNEIRAHG